ncbi:BglI family type II restriction endonuclease [Celeribacter litoreus]|uniref:BglI family type II restriction endonuclease n=1 Tax=Celeribacter litoreus TaxID=2876714 RepID=UPI001CCE859A|nr:BglI family type II restriction endonuclease [Celeribacter litoreus]MCA0045108.1 BglI family type II restriction endonuclease [Celeribacter litoreus]
MFEKYQEFQHKIYNEARNQFVADPSTLIELEKYFSDLIFNKLQEHMVAIRRDYDEASYLHAFWKNYPPEKRGRAPVGDQFPWIEVGEHALGSKVIDFLEGYQPRDVGLPTGPDQRYVVSSNDILGITNGITASAWLFIDIKSVGPRDDFSHTVMSHNQISGDGIWNSPAEGISNSILTATGKRTSHPFHCSIPPLYVLSDGTVAPVIMMAIKPVYKMLSLQEGIGESGQPLSKVSLITIPNGIPLTVSPNYLKQHPSLLFPGKDDKGKDPLKVRARISFELLSKIADWRVRTTTLA